MMDAREFLRHSMTSHVENGVNFVHCERGKMNMDTRDFFRRIILARMARGDDSSTAAVEAARAYNEVEHMMDTLVEIDDLPELNREPEGEPWQRRFNFYAGGYQDINWMVRQSNGQLLGFKHKPRLIPNTVTEEVWVTDDGAIKNFGKVLKINDGEPEDWRETLTYVGP